MAISIMDNMDYRGKKHLDGRQYFATKQEMLDFDKNSLAPGLQAYVEEEDKFYYFNATKQDWDPLSAGGGDSGATWTGTDGTVTDVGGLKAGTVLDGKTPLEIIDMMVNPYMSPVVAISISPNTTLYEVGTQATVTVTANLTKKTNEITASKILKDNVDLKVANGDELTAKTFSQANVQVDVDTTFSSKVSDNQGEVSGNSITIKFTRRSYYGLIGAGDSVTDDGAIEALGKNQLTGTKGLTWSGIDATNQKLVYAYPASFGNLTSIKDANNFEYLSSFDKTTVQRDSVDYNVYTLRDPMSITGAKITFA